MTKNRRDLVKGFVDNSAEGTNLDSLIQMQNARDPRELFHLFPDLRKGQFFFQSEIKSLFFCSYYDWL